jgi:hypothetical protein
VLTKELWIIPFHKLHSLTMENYLNNSDTNANSILNVIAVIEK